MRREIADPARPSCLPGNDATRLSLIFVNRRWPVRLGSVLLLIWLVIGAFAAGQRHYYTTSSANCAGAGTIAVTILAGPLNYVGANPKLVCH
jgi:hypothetical protein